MKRLAPLLLIVLSLFISPFAWSQDGQDANSAQQAETWRNFSNLIATMEHVRDELGQARQVLSAAQFEGERKEAEAEVERLSNELSSLQMAWELWATGGVDLQLFTPSAQQQEKKFDWREELQSVFEPIIVEMRRLTERPRKIERLRSEHAYLQQRLTAADEALKSVNGYHIKAPTPDLVAAFSNLEGRWQRRRDDLQTRIDLVNFELQELMAPKSDQEGEAIETLKQLFTGRLLNLLLAVLAGAVVYGLFWQLNQLYARYLMRRGHSPQFLTRVVHLSLVLIASLLALLAGMSVLYAQGDWILLGLMIIILAGLVLVLQRSLPGYINEARLMLNIGPVREGERIIYQGLPWRVQSLRLQATLLNPLLSGGVLRLPLRELNPLISRVANEREPWFPTRENDYVVLGDDTYGQVVLQTPETVQLRVASAIKTFSTQSFLGQAPKNLSLEGFLVLLRFGLDYRHQAEVTGAIRDAFEKALTVGVRHEPQGKYLQTLAVEFAEAASSSLDFLIIARFSGEAADSYMQLKRLLQRIALDTCNAQGWAIPFDQMTVHLVQDERIESPPLPPLPEGGVSGND
jgi:small-conductance mechanosensitive channel